VDFSEARNLFGIIFQIPGAFMKICGLRVDIQEVQGPFCKVVEIKEFPDLIYNGKFRGPSPRCGGPTTCSGPRWTAGGVDTGRGGALPMHGTRALGLAGAHDEAQQGEGGHEELDRLLTGARAKNPSSYSFLAFDPASLTGSLGLWPSQPHRPPSPLLSPTSFHLPSLPCQPTGQPAQWPSASPPGLPPSSPSLTHGSCPSSSSSSRSATMPPPPPPASLEWPACLRLPYRAVPLPVTAAPPRLLSPLRLPTSLTPSRPKRPAINAATMGRHRPAHELPPPPYKSHQEQPRTAPPLLTRSSASLLARASLSPAHRLLSSFPSIAPGGFFSVGEGAHAPGDGGPWWRH
jgi:hypothetical protein